MRLLDVLGRRWSLRVLWELRGGPLSFRALRTACDEVSPSSLNRRLGELRALGAVDAGDAGYELSPRGRALAEIVLALHRWSESDDPQPPPQAAKAGAKARRPAASRRAKR
jgi:DNA-binding HxlR family transcriptional regulator